MKVDVVLCTFNGERFLAAQFESIERQTRRPDRVLVFDDGSTDGTLGILEDFRLRLPLSVKVNPARLGPAANFSQALEHATADAVFLCDQDDLWHPGKVQAMLDLLAARPDALLGCSDARLIDAAGRPVRGSLLERIAAPEARALSPAQLQVALLKRNLITGATCAVRRSLLTLALPVPDGFWHDEWLALVAASMDGIAWADRSLTDYRLHGGNAAGVDQVGAAATLRALGADAVAYRLSKAQKLDRLARTLRAIPERLLPERLAAVESAARHWRFRAQLPAWGRGRITQVVAESRLGGYRRFSAGWRSALRDLLGGVERP